MIFRNQLRHYKRLLGIAAGKVASWLRQADVSIFYKFHRPPWGGGNQFMMALCGEWEQRGLRVENNTISVTTRACLFNSFNFDFELLRWLRRPGCRMIHRVDGPVSACRGWDDGTDYRTWEINQELADATVFQSNYSLQKWVEMGFEFKSPTVIMNAVNPSIFYPAPSRPDMVGRKVRLISVSWSENPNKGASTYKWLEEHLDRERFDYTFVGRSPIRFKRICMLDPVSSEQLAALLRQHDISITASLHDPCSNVLIEALSCGLPAIYLKSGGHPEIVGEAGFGFSEPEEIPGLLQWLVDEYQARRERIFIPALAEVADRYLAVMGIEASPTK